MNVRILLCALALMALGAWEPARAADNVLISEFMAVNDGTLLDEDGDSEDWVELHNAGPNTVNLDGWFLTDKLSQNRLGTENALAGVRQCNERLVVVSSEKSFALLDAP